MDRSELFQRLRSRPHKVPFSTELYPETTSLQNVLEPLADGTFRLTTTFVEFAAGHGYSGTQQQVEIITEQGLHDRLRWVDEAAFVAL